MLDPKLVGALMGLALGVVLIWFGPLKAFLLGLFILAGWLVGKFWAGEIDILEVYEDFLRSRGRRPRR